jgi:hypothetical protein
MGSGAGPAFDCGERVREPPLQVRTAGISVYCVNVFNMCGLVRRTAMVAFALLVGESPNVWRFPTSRPSLIFANLPFRLGIRPM